MFKNRNARLSTGAFSYFHLLSALISRGVCSCRLVGPPSFIGFRQLPTGPGSTQLFNPLMFSLIGFQPSSADYRQLNVLRLTPADPAFTIFAKLSTT